MIEVTVSRLAYKLNKFIQEKALNSLNRRSIRNIEKYNQQELQISQSRKFLDQMESQLEVEYQKVDAELVEAFRCVRENTPVT